MSLQLGIIGIVGKELESDLAGTLKRLRALGYRGIELGVGSLQKLGGAERVRAALDDAGLEVITIHTGREMLRDDFDGLVAACRASGSRHATISWAPLDSPESIKADAELYNRCGPALRERGITLCYHNHEHEFTTRFGGRFAMDMLLGAVKPEALAMHFDVAWGTFGGINPAAFIERYRGRVPLIHLKDLYDLSVRNCFTAPGTGLVDLRGCLRAARETGVEWAVIEQDSPRHISGLDLATAAALNLRELGFSGD